MRTKSHVLFLIVMLLVIPLHSLAGVQLLLNVPGFEGPVNFNNSQDWMEVQSFQFPKAVAGEIGIPAGLNSSIDVATIKFVRAGQVEVPKNAVFSAMANIGDTSIVESIIAFLEKSPRHRQWKLALCNEQGQILLGFGMDDVTVLDIEKADSGVKISFNCKLQQWWEKVLR
jgi:hypothetical protein